MEEKNINLYTQEHSEADSPKRQILKSVAGNKKPTALVLKQSEYNQKYTVQTPKERESFGRTTAGSPNIVIVSSP